MSDFKNFKGGAESGGQKSGQGEMPKSGAQGSEQQAINLAATLAKAFAGKSEGEIFSTIIAQAEQGKRDGTLTNADLDNFYKTLAPLLDGFKRKKLQQIIAKLKAI